MKYLLLITHAPYSAPLLARAYLFAAKLLAKGSRVVIFHYMDGLHCLSSHQQPRAFMNIEQLINDLIEGGATVVGCSRCAAARGYVDQSFPFEENALLSSEKITPGVEIVSVLTLGRYLAEGYRLIQC
jgi:tRNA 2-thiouridine synthesizing protein D